MIARIIASIRFHPDLCKILQRFIPLFLPAPIRDRVPGRCWAPFECFASSHLLSTGLLSNDAKQQIAIIVLDQICHLVML